MQGSISKRIGVRGVTWYGRYDIVDPMTGKRKYKRMSAATRKECEVLLREAIRAAENGGGEIDKRITIRDYVDQWLASVESRLRPGTHWRYADALHRHVVPDLGSVRLGQLTALDLERLYASHLQSGLSPTTVSLIHAVIHGALKQAVRWGLVERNVSDLVHAPRSRTPDVATWDAHQAAAVLAVGDNTDLAALWRLALLCGMRRGELLGLMWDDIDLDRGVLSVRRQLVRGSGSTWQLGQPKTASGRRSIALPQTCVAELRRHGVAQKAERLRGGPAWEDHGFVFTNVTGGPLHPTALKNRFNRLIEAVGVPRIRFHDLRHTCATLLLAQGTHPKIVQERLGHSNVSMTLNRYSHVTPTMQRQAADALDQMLIDARDVA